MAVYFFLAGIAVNHRPYLWVTPATSAIFAAILAFVSSASMKLAFYKKSSRSEQILWCNNAVQLLYSSFISLLSSYQLQKASWNLIPKPGNRFDTMLVCIAMGFVGYQVGARNPRNLSTSQPVHLRCGFSSDLLLEYLRSKLLSIFEDHIYNLSCPLLDTLPPAVVSVTLSFFNYDKQINLTIAQLWIVLSAYYRSGT